MMIDSLLIFFKRWPLCYLLFLAFACASQKEKENSFDTKRDSVAEEKKINNAFLQINEATKTVNAGDLILRTGKDFISDVMRKLSQHDKTYSHCGIANWENDTLFVYHALGGEFNPDQKIRRDAFEFFCNPYQNRGFGIFRYKINPGQQKNIIQLAKQYYSQQIMFDMQFDLETNDRMYCSEYVYKSIVTATSGATTINTTTLNKIQFIAVDNLFINPNCEEIKRIKFE